jgi:hypothetical protein
VPAAGAPDTWSLTVKAPRAGAPGTSGGGGDGGGEGAPAIVSQTLDLKRADLLSLRSMFATAVPWISGWMLHLNPAAFDHDLHVVRKGEDGAAE